MRLEYKSRYGKFYLGSDEESYSCHVAVYDDENKRLISTNIHPDYDLNGNDPEEIMDEIQEAIKRTWTTGDDRKECWQFILDHQAEIEYGNDVYELNQTIKEVEKLSSRAAVLSKRIADATESSSLTSVLANTKPTKGSES